MHHHTFRIALPDVGACKMYDALDRCFGVLIHETRRDKQSGDRLLVWSRHKLTRQDKLEIQRFMQGFFEALVLSEQ